MQEEAKRELIKAALAARERAYSPYSGYAVGASVLTAQGNIYTGCNVENASYGATNCAERTAVFKAVSEGEQKCRAVAIAGGRVGSAPADYAYPCGICRQVMREFGGEELLVLVAKSEEDYREYALRDLLPCGFGGENLI